MTITVVEDPTILRDPVEDFYARAELREAEQEQDDKAWLAKAAVVLGAGFLVWRGVQAYRMRQERPGDVEGAMRRAWIGGARKAWEAASTEVIASAYRRGAGRILTEEQLYMAAMAHVELLGKHVYDTSSQAVQEGFIAQLNKGVQENLAWQRAIEGLGLDSRQMRSYVMALPDATGYQAQVIPSGLSSKVERMLIDRGDRIAQNELWTGRSMAKSLAWSFLKSNDLLPEGSQKVWRTAEDETVCDICRPMDGKAVDVDEDFRTSEGRVYAPTAHPNCRCDIEVTYSDEVEKAYRVWDETKVKRDREGQFSREEERIRQLAPPDTEKIDAPVPSFAPATSSPVPVFGETQSSTEVPVFARTITETPVPVFTETPVPVFTETAAPVFTETAVPVFTETAVPVFTLAEPKAPAPAPAIAPERTQIDQLHFVNLNNMNLTDEIYKGQDFVLDPYVELSAPHSANEIDNLRNEILDYHRIQADSFRRAQDSVLADDTEAREAWKQLQLDALDRMDRHQVERMYEDHVTIAHAGLSESALRRQLADEIQSDTDLGFEITRELAASGLLYGSIEYQDKIEELSDRLDDLTEEIRHAPRPVLGVAIFPKGYQVDELGRKVGRYRVARMAELDIQDVLNEHTSLPHDPQGFTGLMRSKPWVEIGADLINAFGVTNLLAYAHVGINRINVVVVEPVEEE